VAVKTLSRDRNIEHWDAEDVEAWQAGAANIAKRNLIWSIFAEHVGFSIWSIWSVMVLFMPQSTYHIDAAGKFYLVAMPTLVGAFMRIPYTVAPAKFGGRNWTIVSALLLLIPAVLTLWVMTRPDSSYTTFMVVAAFAGLGGGNFASPMTNINAFYPQRLKGWALGLNAGGGNIGVPVIQLVGLLVIATVSNTAPEIVCAIYLVAIALAADATGCSSATSGEAKTSTTETISRIWSVTACSAASIWPSPATRPTACMYSTKCSTTAPTYGAGSTKAPISTCAETPAGWPKTSTRR
jgi:NNP family nitrate/nitrite transporter-like MFS transporter